MFTPRNVSGKWEYYLLERRLGNPCFLRCYRSRFQSESTSSRGPWSFPARTHVHKRTRHLSRASGNGVRAGENQKGSGNHLFLLHATSVGSGRWARWGNPMTSRAIAIMAFKANSSSTRELYRCEERIRGWGKRSEKL